MTDLRDVIATLTTSDERMRRAWDDFQAAFVARQAAAAALEILPGRALGADLDVRGTLAGALGGLESGEELETRIGYALVRIEEKQTQQAALRAEQALYRARDAAEQKRRLDALNATFQARNAELDRARAAFEAASSGEDVSAPSGARRQLDAVDRQLVEGA